MATNKIKRGAFIVFEGCDKSGKTTQCKILVENLCKQGKKAQFIQFPDRSTPTGKLLDNYLKRKENLADEAVHLLFSANRWEFQNNLKELLTQNTTLIADRYSYSGIAYSAAKPKMDFDWCCNAEIGLIKPDLVFFLQVPINLLKKRYGFGEERYENSEFLESVNKNFLKLQDSTWVVIDATKTIEELEKEVMDHSIKIIGDLPNEIEKFKQFF